MTPIEIISITIAVIASVWAWIAHRKVGQAYKDSAETINWLISKLEKNRYDARKEYDKTGWSPTADKPPTSD